MKYSDKLILLYEKLSKLNFLLSNNLPETKKKAKIKSFNIPDDLYQMIKIYYLQNKN